MQITTLILVIITHVLCRWPASQSDSIGWNLADGRHTKRQDQTGSELIKQNGKSKHSVRSSKVCCAFVTKFCAQWEANKESLLTNKESLLTTNKKDQ